MEREILSISILGCQLVLVFAEGPSVLVFMIWLLSQGHWGCIVCTGQWLGMEERGPGNMTDDGWMSR
jgi:hypothetical protein